MKKSIQKNIGGTFLKILMLTFLVFLGGCSFMSNIKEYQSNSLATNSEPSKSVVVLIDGTGNGPESKTNLWILKEAFEKYPGNASIDYIGGVGSASNPLLGQALGFTMEEGILKGYRFLSKNVGPNDRIFIFGFSRGAHQARALAGLISYVGLLDVNEMNDRKILVEANKIIEITKKYDDEGMASSFRERPKTPPLSSEVQNLTGNTTRAAYIEFLGIWDTVPGSSFKEYGLCSEKVDSKPGERYKTGSYPFVKNTFHAVSLDEKRSKFAPILLCKPIMAGLTNQKEVWFSGAHADVGGGYEDGELQTISMAWMGGELQKVLAFPLSISSPGSSLAAAHWSFGDGIASFKSNCENRIVPEDAELHASVNERKRAGVAKIKVNDVISIQPYPKLCE